MENPILKLIQDLVSGNNSIIVEMDKAKDKPKLVPEEQELADSLLKIAEKYGAEVIVFSKKDYAGKFDIMDNFDGNKVIVYAEKLRNPGQFNNVSLREKTKMVTLSLDAPIH